MSCAAAATRIARLGDYVKCLAIEIAAERMEMEVTGCENVQSKSNGLAWWVRGERHSYSLRKSR